MIITIKFTAKHINFIHVKGHANSNVAGKDLVCAGVSCIVFGGLNALNEMIAVNKWSYHKKDADIYIESLEEDKTLNTIMETMYYQLKTIALENKKYITIQEV